MYQITLYHYLDMSKKMVKIYIVFLTIKSIRLVTALITAITLTSILVVYTGNHFNSNKEGVYISTMHDSIKGSEIDPAKFLTNFEYGQVSILDDGTILRVYHNCRGC